MREMIREGSLELGYMNTVLRDNYNIGEEKMGKLEISLTLQERRETKGIQ